MSEPEEDFMGGLDDLLNQDRPIPQIVEEKEDQEPKPKPEDEPKPNDDDEEPAFTRNPKEKKTKEDSISELRTSRDDYKKKTEAFTSILGDNDPVILKPLLELITDLADGPVTIEVVNNIVAEVKEKDAEIADLKLKLDEQEKTVARIDIQHSPVFAKKYKEPYIEANKALFAEYANVAEDGSIIAQDLTQKLHNYFIENADKIDGIQAKQQLTAFAKQYKQQTGEDPILPSVTSLMGSVRSFKAKRESMAEAYSDWQRKKNEDEQSSTAQQEQERELLQKKSKRERTALASKAFNDFDIDSVDFMEGNEVEDLFREEYRSGEKIFSGAEVPSYDVMLARGVKAKLWDKMLPKIKELMELEKKINEAERSGLKGNDRFQPTKSKAGEDWLGGVSI